MKDQVQSFLNSRSKHRAKIFAGLMAFIVVISLALIAK
jgi:hypothetical protein